MSPCSRRGCGRMPGRVDSDGVRRVPEDAVGPEYLRRTTYGVGP